jgi:hypothetical protein
LETDNTANNDSSEENQDLTHTDRLLKGLELNINLVENSSKVIETIEEQSPILERELMTTATHIKNLTSRLSMHESVTKVAENVMNSIRAEYNISINETKNNLDEDTSLSQYENYLDNENEKDQFINIDSKTVAQSAEDEDWLKFKENNNKFIKNQSFDDEENYIYEKQIKECKTPNSSIDEATSYEQSEMKRLSLNSIRVKLEQDDSIQVYEEHSQSIEQVIDFEEFEIKPDEMDNNENEFYSSSNELNKSTSTTILHDSNTCQNMVQEPVRKFETFVEEVRIDSKLLNVSNYIPASESTEPLIEEKIDDHDFEVISNQDVKDINVVDSVVNNQNSQTKDYLSVATIGVSESSEPLIGEDYDQKVEHKFILKNNLINSRSSSDDGLVKSDEDTSFIKIERKDESFVEPLINSADSSKIQNLDELAESIVDNQDFIESQASYLFTEHVQDSLDYELSDEIIQLNHSDSMKYINDKNDRNISNNSENKSKSLTNLDTLVVSSAFGNQSNDNNMSSNFNENLSNDISLDEISIPKINIQLSNNVSNQVDIRNDNNLESEDSFIVDAHDIIINSSESAELLVSNTESFDKPDYYISKHDENSSEEDTEGNKENNNLNSSINSSTCSSTSSSVRQGTPRVAAKYISITHNNNDDIKIKTEDTSDTICNIRIQGEKKDGMKSSIKQINLDLDAEQVSESYMENFWNKKMTSEDSQELGLLNRDYENNTISSSPDRNEDDLGVNNEKLSDEHEKFCGTEEETERHEMIRSRECDNLNLLVSGDGNETKPEGFILVEKDDDSEDMDSKIAKFVVDNTLKKFEEDTTMLLDDEYESDNEFFSSQRSEIIDHFESEHQTPIFDDKHSHFKRVQSEPVILSEYKPYKIKDSIDDENRESKIVIKETDIVPEIEFKLPQQLLEKLNRNIEIEINSTLNDKQQSKILLDEIKVDEDKQKFEGEVMETSPSILYQEASELIEEVIQNALNIIELTENILVEENVNLKRERKDDDDDHSDEESSKNNDIKKRKDQSNDEQNQNSNAENRHIDKESKSAPNEHNETALETEYYEPQNDNSTDILVAELLKDKELIDNLQNDIQNEIISIEMNHQAILEKVYKDEFEPLINDDEEASINSKILVSSPNETWFDEYKIDKKNFTETQSFDDEENYIYEKDINKSDETYLPLIIDRNILKNNLSEENILDLDQKEKEHQTSVPDVELQEKNNADHHINEIRKSPNQEDQNLEYDKELYFNNDFSSCKQLDSVENAKSQIVTDYHLEKEENEDQQSVKNLSNQDLNFISQNEEQNNEKIEILCWNQLVDCSGEKSKTEVENISEKVYSHEKEENQDQESVKNFSNQDLNFISRNDNEEFQLEDYPKTTNDMLNDQNEIMKELIDEEQKLIQLFVNISDKSVFDLTKTPTNEESFIQNSSSEENLASSLSLSKNLIQEAKVLGTEFDDVQSRIDSTIQASYDAEDSINKRYDEIIDYVKQEQMNMDQLFDYQLDLLKSQIQFNTTTSSNQIDDSSKKSLSSSQSFETANEEIKKSNSNSNSSSYYTANEKNTSSSPSHYFSACMTSSDEMNFINNSFNKFSSNDSFHSAYLTSQDSFDNKVLISNEESTLLDQTLNLEGEDNTLKNTNIELKLLATNQYVAPTDADISPYRDDYMENEMNSAGSSVIVDTDDDEKDVKNNKPTMVDTFPKLVSEIVEFVQNSDLILNKQEKAIENKNVIEEAEEENNDEDKFDEHSYTKQIYEGQSFLESVPEVPEIDSASNSIKLDSSSSKNDFDDAILNRDFDNVLRHNKAETSPDKKRSSTTSSVLEFERLEAQCNTESDKDNTSNTSKMTDFDTTTEESILESVIEEETKPVDFPFVKPPTEFSNDLQSLTAINTATTTPVNEISESRYTSAEPSSINSPTSDNDKTIELTSENLKFHNSSSQKTSVDTSIVLVEGNFVLNSLNRDRKNSSSRSSSSSLSSSSKSDSLEHELNEKITIDNRSFFAKKSKAIAKIPVGSSVAVENLVTVESIPNFENNQKTMVTSLCIDSGQSSMVGSYIETHQSNVENKQNLQTQEREMVTSTISSSICSSLTTSSTSENNFSQPIEIDVSNKEFLLLENIQESHKSDESSSTKSVSPTFGIKKRFSSSSSGESQSKSSFSSTHTIIHVAAGNQKSIFSGEDLPSFTKTSLSKSSGDIINSNINVIDTCVSNNPDALSSSLNQISMGILASSHTHHSNNCYCGNVTRQPTQSNRGKLKMLM